MELDVHLTADGRLAVFHDDGLLRMCGVPEKLEDLTYAELRKLRLAGQDEHIPLLGEVLSTVGAGRRSSWSSSAATTTARCASACTS